VLQIRNSRKKMKDLTDFENLLMKTGAEPVTSSSRSMPKLNTSFLGLISDLV
jgi:hypothetical protein